MSRHIPRRNRWVSHGATGFRSVDGLIVRRFKGEWWAVVAYELSEETLEGGAARMTRHEERIGPFRRSRNAMVEIERHVVMLRNRHGARMRVAAVTEPTVVD